MAATTRSGIRLKGLLTLNIDMINQEDELSYRLNDTAYRQEGVTIGRDYLRVEGITITRGELLPALLDVQEIIGKGAFSTVRRAHWHRIKAKEEVVDVAVKDCSLVTASHQRRQMLLKELRSLCKLNSPALVQLYGAFLQPEENSVSMVLEFMDRGSLQGAIDKSQGFPEVITAAITFQMLSGLAFLHDPERRIIHRDLKPANVLLHSTGAVKLCDFGMATLLADDSLNLTVIGTARFMAPERLRAMPYGRPSDVWSLGLIILECVIGEVLWKDVNSMVELIVTIEESTTPSDLIGSASTRRAVMSEGVQEILAGCLQVQPGTS